MRYGAKFTCRAAGNDDIQTRPSTDPQSIPVIAPSCADFLRVARPGLRVPLAMQIPDGGTLPFQAYQAFRKKGKGALLETGRGMGRSVVAVDIAGEWTFSATDSGDPFGQLRQLCSDNPIAPNPLLRRFGGGLIGWFSYDLCRVIERIPTLAADDLQLPLCYFQLVDSFIEFDHQSGVLTLATLPVLHDGDMAAQYRQMEARLQEMMEVLSTLPPPEADTPPDTTHADPLAFAPTVTPDQFAATVRRTREYIFAGDIFQANLSVRFQRAFGTDPLLLYRQLRKINPSPFMAFIEGGDCAVVSASPELLLRASGPTIETRPIAGTRRRGATEAEDQEKIAELLANEKERAEHLMLVDLERNDIGRVARYGTVQVNELMTVEKYSHVIHIVSNVCGELREGMDTLDALRACFPGGTITGAPKVRSMEIIEELEPTRRGIYTGSIGWLGWNGDAEFNIAIRTLLVKNGVAYLQAGAGIVADSVPEHEYRESLRKAQAAMNAVESALAQEEKEKGREKEVAAG
ncbi:MAG: anthranilate synthase component I family protein [Candidatus Kapabacteria bacterium]|nr:anthranilate synthase component I family protein [Candidatus Kapabacteria bacterium]